MYKPATAAVCAAVDLSGPSIIHKYEDYNAGGETFTGTQLATLTDVADPTVNGDNYYEGTDNYWSCDFTDIATGATCYQFLSKLSVSTPAAFRFSGGCDDCTLQPILMKTNNPVATEITAITWASAVGGVVAGASAIALTLLSI